MTPRFALVLALLASPATAGEVIPAASVRIIDGDTLALVGHPAACPGARGDERVRLIGLDAPEIHRAACPAEAMAGLRASAGARALIGAAARLHITRHGCDRYRRTLATVALIPTTGAAHDLTRAMISTGHARPWKARGGANRWCL